MRSFRYVSATADASCRTTQTDSVFFDSAWLIAIESTEQKLRAKSWSFSLKAWPSVRSYLSFLFSNCVYGEDIHCQTTLREMTHITKDLQGLESLANVPASIRCRRRTARRLLARTKSNACGSPISCPTLDQNGHRDTHLVCS